MTLSVRLMMTSDLPKLIGLFERAYVGYAGFAERSVADFHWRYLDRPDIGKEGVIVVEGVEHRLIGYVVVGTSGTIWEFAIDLDAERQKVATILIAEAERFLMESGVDEIVLHAPVDDLDMAAALQMAGYGGGLPIQQYLSFIDIPRVVEHILVKHRDVLPGGLGTMEFVIRNPRAWHPERFSPPMSDETSASTQRRLPSIVIDASVEALVGVMVGSESPSRAVASGRVRITPLSKTATGLKILRALRLRDPFFFTAADVI